MSFPSQHLFPNIETLHWFVESPDFFPHVAFFLGPRLRDLSLGKFSTLGHLSFLATVATQCPLLVEVDIGFSDDMEVNGQFQSLSWFVRSLRHLKKLTVPSLDRAALDYIAQLPTLVSLTLNKQCPFAAAPTSTLGDGVFARLNSLDMAGNTIGALSEITTLLTLAPIMDIDTSFPKLTTSYEIAQFYAVIAANCSNSSLSKLRMGGPMDLTRDVDAVTVPNDWITSSQIRPLLLFSNLTVVQLSTPRGFSLDDTTVADMARAWPHLQTLNLFASDYHTHIPSTLPLSALLHFARHCPKLSELTLSLDGATPVPKWGTEQTETERVQQWHLERLYVHFSPIAAPPAVAVFLSSIFPTLKVVGSSHRTDRVPHKHWNEVHMALPALRAARAEEVYWTRRAHS